MTSTAVSGREGGRFWRMWTCALVVSLVGAALGGCDLVVSTEEEESSFSDFMTQLERHLKEIQHVTLEPQSNTLTVREIDGDEYSTGYPSELIERTRNRARRNEIEIYVEKVYR